MKIMARILKRGITLTTLIPGISLTIRTSFLKVFLLFLKYNCEGNDYDEMTQVSILLGTFIHCLELVKIIYKINENKLSLCNQTYSWIKFIPLSRIQTISDNQEIQDLFVINIVKMCRFRIWWGLKLIPSFLKEIILGTSFKVVLHIG